MSAVESLQAYLKNVRKKGYEPAVVIATQHGECLCYHIYAMRESEGNPKIAFVYLRYSDDQNVVSDQVKYFDNADDWSKNCDDTRIQISRIPKIEFTDEEIKRLEEAA